MRHPVRAQRRWMDPAAFWKEQAACGQADPCTGAGDVAVQRLQQITGKVRRQLGLALGILGGQRQLQYPTGRPGRSRRKGLQLTQGQAEPVQDQPAERGVMGRQLEVEHALGIAGGLLCGCPVALDDPDLPAAAGKAGRGSASGESRAYHDCRSRTLGLRRTSIPGNARADGRTLQRAGQHLPLVAETRHLGHGEARFVEASADETGAGEGGQGGAGTGQARQLGEQRRCPHFGIFRWSEAIQEPGVTTGIQFGQALQYIADQQGEGDTAVAQNQSLKAWVDGLVLLLQRCAVGRQFRPEGQGLGEIGGGQRKALDTDEMQARTLGGQGLEQLPGA